MISELRIETTLNLTSAQTFPKGSSPTLYQRCRENAYLLLISNQSPVAFHVNDLPKELEAQSVFLCLPGDILRMDGEYVLESDIHLILFEYFPPDRPDAASRPFKSAVQLPVKAMIDYPEFYSLLAELLKETCYDIYNYKPRQNILLAYLLLVLCRYCKNKEWEESSVETGELPPYVKIVLDYLDSSFQKDISSNDIQERLCMNYDYLNTLFKRCLGITIMKYLDNVRISLARELLQHTILPINEIAREVGIPNPQYFTKKFNALTGRSPLKYRQYHSMS